MQLTDVIGCKCYFVIVKGGRREAGGGRRKAGGGRREEGRRSDWHS